MPRPGSRWTRLEDFLDWVLLIEALTLRPGMQTWGAVAGALDVHQRSLSRSAKRFLGVTLRETNPLAALTDDAVDLTLGQFFGASRI